MNNGFQFLDIIVFAVIAGFLVLRLRSVLGRRTGQERRPPPFGMPPAEKKEGEAGEDKLVVLPSREARREAAAGPLGAGLTQIRIADPSFDPDAFVGGARRAFEIIVDSFAKGDHDTLRALLSDEVYGNFARAIAAREGRGETLELTLVGIGEATVIEAAMDGSRATLTVKFVSEQIRVTRDAKGQAAEAGTGRATTITDIWTFARDTKSRNPNWILVATEAAN